MSARDDGAGPAAAAVTPADAVELRELRFAGDGTVPNNPDLPVLLMRGAIAPGASAEAVAARLEASGWGGTWVWRVFPYHYYHPNAHEALAVAAGRAELMLGGRGASGWRSARGTWSSCRPARATASSRRARTSRWWAPTRRGRRPTRPSGPKGRTAARYSAGSRPSPARSPTPSTARTDR